MLVVLQLNNEFMAVDNMKFIDEIYAKVRQIQRKRTFPPDCNWA